MKNHLDQDEILGYNDRWKGLWVVYDLIDKGLYRPLEIPDHGVLGELSKCSYWSNTKIVRLTKEEYKVWAVKQKLMLSNRTMTSTI